MTVSAPTQAPLRTLLLGERGSFVNMDSYEAMLLGYGFEVEWVESGYMTSGHQIPKGCEAVIMLFELQGCAHGVADQLRGECNALRIPFIILSYKKAHAAQTLERHGYKPRAPEGTPVPLAPKIAVDPTTTTLDDVKLALKQNLKMLRDRFNVESVTYDKTVGLEIVYRKSDVESIDE